MKLYAYKMTVDSGFAPCPFPEEDKIITLATCKPGIREKREVGDWIAGFTSKTLNGDDYGKERLIYLMKVTDKITFTDYWKAYKNRRPKTNPQNNKDKLGDNIYKPLKKNPQDENDYEQLKNSSHKDKNKKTDLSSDKVLISKKFYYFGSEPIELSDDIKPVIPKRQTKYGCKNTDEEQIKKLIDHVKSKYKKIGTPHKWFKNGDAPNKEIKSCC